MDWPSDYETLLWLISDPTARLAAMMVGVAILSLLQPRIVLIVPRRRAPEFG